MKKNIVFDTMIYRYIGRLLKSKSEGEKDKFKRYFFNAEKEQGFKPLFNILVGMELLSHLRYKDQHYEECKEGLLFAYEHSPQSFMPYPDILFTQYFFSYSCETYKKFLSCFADVWYRIFLFNGSDEVILESLERIKEFSTELEDIKQEILNLIVKSVELAGEPDRANNHSVFPNNEKERAKIRKYIANNIDGYHKSLASSFLKRIALLSEVQNINQETNKIQYLIDNHRAVFEKFRLINLKMIDSKNINLANPKTKSLNEFTDCLIMMSLSPYSNNILVTEEKENIKIIKSVGLQDWVIAQKEYFETIGLGNIIQNCF
jgi:hypothetical protein